jgi:hypothetical protein
MLPDLGAPQGLDELEHADGELKEPLRQLLVPVHPDAASESRE